MNDTSARSESTSRRSSYERPLSVHAAKAKQVSATFSLAQLQFEKLLETSSLIGREEECCQLRNALDFVIKNKKRGLVWIEGPSGTGKTALAQSLRRVVKGSPHHGFYMSGKFDLSSTQIPFQGMLQALGDLCTQLKSTTPDLSTILREELESELPFLIQLLPNLEESIFGGTSAHINANEKEYNSKCATTSSNKDTADQLKFSVRQFIGCVSSRAGPIVWLMDDIQWADQQSLDLMEALLKDSASISSSSLLFVASCRTNDNDNNSTSHALVSKLEGTLATERNIHLTKLSIGNLNVTQVNHILEELLMQDTTQTKPLAILLHQRTFGNIFYLIQLLQSLHDQGLLVFHLGLFQWTWNLSQIRDESTMTDNVASLLRHKFITKVPVANQILPLAACLGSTFESETVDFLWNGLKLHDARQQDDADDNANNNNSSSLPSVAEQLKECQKEGFIQAVTATTTANDDEVDGTTSTHYNQSTYRFVHDKIQEAALALYSKTNLNQLKYDMGNLMASTMSKESLNKLIFTVVAFLDAQDDNDPPPIIIRFRNAQLNLQAAQKAMTIAAFQTAATSCFRAMKLLSSSPPHDGGQHGDYPTDSYYWETHYDTCIELYSVAAEAEFCLGNFDVMRRYRARLVQRAKSNNDKLRVNKMLLETLLSEKKIVQSLEFGLQVLAEFGCHLPKLFLPMKTIVGVVKAKSWSKKMRENEKLVASLKVTNNPAHIGSMMFMDLSSTCAYYVGRKELFTLLVLKAVKYTFRYGITKYSPPAFATMALMMTNLGNDPAVGRDYADVAMKLLEKVNSKEVEARTMGVAYSHTYMFLKPLRDNFQALLDAQTAGLSAGDSNSGFTSIYFYLEGTFYAGQSLSVVEENLQSTCSQMKDYGCQQLLEGMEITLQAVKILRDTDSQNSTATLTGDIVDQEDLIRRYSEANQDIYLVGTQRMQLVLASYFGEHQVGAALCEAGIIDRSLKLIPGHTANMVVPYLGACCCYSMARKTLEKKYRKIAYRLHSITRSWATRKVANNPNCAHQLLLLNAEEAALLGKKDEAYKYFESGILLAAKGGYIQDQALGNRRFAEYCCEKKDANEASYRLQEASKLFHEWGAERVVQTMLQQYDKWVKKESSGPIMFCLKF